MRADRNELISLGLEAHSDCGCCLFGADDRWGEPLISSVARMAQGLGLIATRIAGSRD
jgi:hypothetical protein